MAIYIHAGPLGPEFAKIRARCGSTTAPEFAEPTRPVRFRRRGGTSGPPGNGPMGASGPTKDQTHLRIRRRGGCPHPPAGPLSQTRAPPTQKARFPPIEETPKGYRTLSGSGNRRETSQLSHPRLCDNCLACLIGGPRKNRGPGKGDYEHGSAHRSRPRWRFAYFAVTGKVGRRPQAAKSPAEKGR